MVCETWRRHGRCAERVGLDRDCASGTVSSLVARYVLVSLLVVEHGANIPTLFLALYVLYTYMLKQRRKVLGKGKTVGGVSKAQ